MEVTSAALMTTAVEALAQSVDPIAIVQILIAFPVNVDQQERPAPQIHNA